MAAGYDHSPLDFWATVHKLWVCHLRLVRWLHVLDFCLPGLWMGDVMGKGMEVLFKKISLADCGT